MFERLEASGEEFLGPIETLRYVKRNRSKIKNPIVVLFWIDGRLWCLCVDLRVGVGGLRLVVYQRGLGDRWSEHVRFLVRPRKSE